MNVLICFNGGDLDAGNESYSQGLCGSVRLLETRNGVVIGDTDDREAGAPGSGYELGGRKGAV